ATVLAGALVGCAQPVEPPNSSQGEEPMEVVTAVAETRPFGVQIEAVGTARANESVEVTSKTTNTVTAIRFNEGDLVRRGQVLVELDSAEARAELAEAQAALVDSESQFKRSRDLFASKALSESQLEQIEATLKANRARLAAAQARLDDTTIRAGFSGRTGFRRVSIGSLVTPGTVITTLDDTSVIKLDFTVPETYLYVLQKGLPIVARTAGLPGREFTGEVTNLDSRVDPITRSIMVRAEIPNEDGLLRPGMFMTVSLQGAPKPSLLVPEEAIVPEQGGAFVFVVRDGVVERRQVRLGKRRPGEVEIVEGLSAREHVIVEGAQHVRDGVRVRERLHEPPPRAST
ncbi:MAG TPA: efflux RND transporter periplasmic adaptor subunit, partial [Steroidobacter sp.]|nr:efflux RND transporter periplasmic adaptor subunit [Steroidobacter sp.]